jgi:predicted TIM-barrel enzyme
MRIPRREILAALRSQVADGNAIIGSSAGTGLSAKAAEAGGADLIFIYNSGRFRMAGRGSAAGLLPYGDANAIVMDMVGEVLPVVKKTPVVAGVCATDPLRQMPIFLEDLKRQGFSGVQNFPTVGLFEGLIRTTFEETGMGFDLEVNMIRLAHELDLLTAPYVFDERQATAMAEAGADILVPHMGTTADGGVGAITTITMDESVRRINVMLDAAKEVKPDILVICHGGPIVEPEQASEIMARVPGVVGFLGASSTERLPVEAAIADTIRRFKTLARPRDSDGHRVAGKRLPD